MSEFDSDKSDLLDDLARTRGDLQSVIREVSDSDLDTSRRGSWSVARILDHVVHSERLYAQLISVFSGTSAPLPDSRPITSAGDALSQLEGTRAAVLDGVAEVKEQDFYRLQTIGHEEYSVLSILENVASHDREHAEQIRRTIRP